MGDRNTSFYHISTLVRMSINRILSIKNSVGEWTDNEEVVKKNILVGFEKLYSTEMFMFSRQSLISKFACCFLTEEERDWIGRDVTEEEVKDGLWSLRPFKALGPDGLRAGFYQQF